MGFCLFRSKREYFRVVQPANTGSDFNHGFWGGREHSDGRKHRDDRESERITSNPANHQTPSSLTFW